MGERIDQFCENLRVKLTSMDNNVNSIKAKIDGKAANRRAGRPNPLTASRSASSKNGQKWRPRKSTSRSGSRNARRLPSEKIAERKTKGWKRPSCKAEPKTRNATPQQLRLWHWPP